MNLQSIKMLIYFDELKYKFFVWRYNLVWTKKLVLSVFFSLLTGLGAQIVIRLPFTPVPITGQTFFVLLSAILLGKWWGGISQLIYAILGFCGIPWFAGGKGGVAVLFSPTSGYIFGFVLAGFFLGYFVDKYMRARTFGGIIALLIFANFVLIHLPGWIWLWGWYKIFQNTSLPLFKVWELAFFPFVPGDLLKVFLVATIIKGVIPKKAYNGEVDIEEWKKWKLS